MLQILTGYENIDRNIVFSVKEERRTRGHEVILAITRYLKVLAFTRNSK